jgi:dihydroxy-acid dehydratase
MGTEGMKYSLVSREVIADAIETSVNGQCMDGVLVVGGCDKNMPGGMMAIARMNVPAIYVYAGTIRPASGRAEAHHRVAVRGGRRVRRRQHVEGGLRRHRAQRVPDVGACGGMYTANTMSSSFEALGMSLLGSSQMASPDAEKADSAARRRACWSRRSATT